MFINIAKHKSFFYDFQLIASSFKRIIDKYNWKYKSTKKKKEYFLKNICTFFKKKLFIEMLI